MGEISTIERTDRVRVLCVELMPLELRTWDNLQSDLSADRSIHMQDFGVRNFLVDPRSGTVATEDLSLGLRANSSSWSCLPLRSFQQLRLCLCIEDLGSDPHDIAFIKPDSLQR